MAICRDRGYFSCFVVVMFVLDVFAAAVNIFLSDVCFCFRIFAIPFHESVAAFLDYAVLLVFGVILVGFRAGTVGTALGAAFAVILARTSPLQFLFVNTLFADGIFRRRDAAVAAAPPVRVFIDFFQEILDTFPHFLDTVQCYAALSLQGVFCVVRRLGDVRGRQDVVAAAILQ